MAKKATSKKPAPPACLPTIRFCEAPPSEAELCGSRAVQLGVIDYPIIAPPARLLGVVIPTDKPVLNKAWFKRVTGLSGSHIANMMKGARVKRAPRGAKNHEWTVKEAVRTLRYILSHSQNEKVREMTKSALGEITI